MKVKVTSSARERAGFKALDSEQGKYVMPLGKYKNLSLAQIALYDAAYLVWAAKNIKVPFVCGKIRDFVGQPRRRSKPGGAR
jgi:hypothetical protein